jgi:hypothetical protein
MCNSGAELKLLFLLHAVHAEHAKHQVCAVWP